MTAEIDGPHSQQTAGGLPMGWLASSLLRIYLGTLFVSVGYTQWVNFDAMVYWFGHSLQLPYPDLMVRFSMWIQIVGGVALLLGLAVRVAVVPLLIVMLVAALKVHLPNGWYYVSPSVPEANMASLLVEAGIPGARASIENSLEVGQRLASIRQLLQEHGDYPWLTEKGAVVILNNGMEWAVTYGLMLLALFSLGGGRYTSLDYWLQRMVKGSKSTAPRLF